MDKPFTPTRLLFEGRYRKFVRDLPQTVFFCPQCRGRGCNRCEGYGKLTKDSIQELVARVAMPRFKARRNKFHGAGREDMDVRMLGTGRRFVFEMQKVKRDTVDLDDLAADVTRRSDGRIEIFDLKLCDRKRVVEIKETHCAKEYQARVRFEEGVEVDLDAAAKVLDGLAAGDRFEIVQKTPQRVAHRRADIERVRWIDITAWEYDGNDLMVSILSQHGTYIKEAISSDDGRSQPSLSSLLGASCRCVELDVVAILEPET
ncbi:MAG: tRNA pseudouridine(54/55) synthase Pus10 [Planctomycetota bacterium]|jgi:tRNA pseudouridine synthase 10|nr:tRNA pseudouridine(54/55) synthase Pus10 [Planctomycetota bacterium]